MKLYDKRGPMPPAHTEGQQDIILAKSKKKNRWAIRASYATIVFALGVLGLFLYWSLAPTKVLEVKNSPVPSKIFKANGTTYVELDFNYCKYANVQGTVEAIIISSNTEIALPSYQDSGPVTCNSSQKIILPVPRQAVPDTYKYKYTVTYQVNPVRQEVVKFESQPFQLTSN